MTICAACRHPIQPGCLVVPVTRIGDDGDPMMGQMDFAHQQCPPPLGNGYGAAAEWTTAPATWPLP